MDEKITATELVAQTERMLKSFKAFEHAQKLITYLAGLEQNERELKQRVEAAAKEAKAVEIRCAEEIASLNKNLEAQRTKATSEYQDKIASQEKQLKSIKEASEQALTKTRSEHQALLQAIEQERDTLAEVRLAISKLQAEHKELEGKLAKLKATASGILGNL